MGSSSGTPRTRQRGFQRKMTMDQGNAQAAPRTPHFELRRCAFTLIELLVVIAIISLLVSILIPSLTKAKELAQKTVCQTQLQSIHMAFMFYADDNHEVVISNPRDPSNTANCDFNWPSYLTPYFDMRERDYSDPAQPWGRSWLNSPVPSIFHCPAAGKTDVSYALNFDVGWTVCNGPAWGYYLSEGEAHAAQSMRMGDAGGNWLLFSSMLYDSNMLARRHSDGGNYLFCDGHVEWVPAEMGIWTWCNSNYSISMLTGEWN